MLAQVTEIELRVVHRHVAGNMVAHGEHKSEAVFGEGEGRVNLALDVVLRPERQRAAVHFAAHNHVRSAVAFDDVFQICERLKDKPVRARRGDVVHELRKIAVGAKEDDFVRLAQNVPQSLVSGEDRAAVEVGVQERPFRPHHVIMLNEHLNRGLRPRLDVVQREAVETFQHPENLNPDGKRDDIDVIYSGDKSRECVVGRFAPKANPHYRFAAGEAELNTVVATDVLAEGLNLQDCDKVINYDLHWNPVRLIQRFGRIDRIGSEHDRIFAYNFLLEKGIEKQLGLRGRLAARIAEIHETIGEDAAILDPSEQLNEEAMYAIYESKGEQSSLFEEQDEKPMDLNEAEEKLRQLRRDDPAEFERIASLRGGIRTGKVSAQKGIFAFFRRGRFQQLVMLDEQGNVQSRDLSDALKAIACSREERAQPLPEGYNAALMPAKARFDAEAKHREAQRAHAASLTQGQRYVLRE